MRSIAFCLWLLLLFGSSFSIAQERTPITILSCKTWGQPDWTKSENNLKRLGLQKTGARIREEDPNIRSVSFKTELQSFNNEVYLRWLLEDTTIYYDIKVTNSQREILYETTSNQCGLKLPMNVLTTDKHDMLRISIERNKAYNKSNFNWGISFSIKPLSSADRQSILNEMTGTPFNDSANPFSLADFFIKKRLSLDALSTLEHLLVEKPSDSAIIQKYWDTVNDLHINHW